MLEVEFPLVIAKHGLVRVLAVCKDIVDQKPTNLHFFFLENDEDVVIMDVEYDKTMFEDMVETATEALNEMYYNRDVYSHMMSNQRH
jgi:hypothetical protein